MYTASLLYTYITTVSECFQHSPSIKSQSSFVNTVTDYNLNIRIMNRTNYSIKMNECLKTKKKKLCPQTGTNS